MIFAMKQGQRIADSISYVCMPTIVGYLQMYMYARGYSEPDSIRKEMVGISQYGRACSFLWKNVMLCELLHWKSVI
jgi:hypothetical protein